MQQGVERDNRDRDYSVSLRVGLSGGEVSKENEDYFGDPIVEAARLCARCESGQVLATDIVRVMAGRRNRHECRSLGELMLKGLPEPVATVEVCWEPLGGADADVIVVPLPARLAGRPSVGVVGREVETRAIADVFKRVSNGEGREVLLVSGEAGLGKTTLVADAARAAFDTGACVLFGHCEEDLATPYQLFAEALGHFVTHAPEDQLLAHVAAHGSELARLVPALSSRIPDLPSSKANDTDSERFLLFAAAVGLVGMASQAQPLVMVLDDLQWADKASLLLLRHLVAADQFMRVLVLGTYRDSELSRSHPLTDVLAALRRTSGVSRIELSGLDDKGVMALLEATAGHSLDDAGVDLAHAVYRETDGNPFFVREVLRHLAETGTIFQDTTGRWTTENSLDQMALPDSVREVIGARVGRLGEKAERVLSVAAVIGRDFDLDLLARATSTTDDELLDILDAASTASLVRELADSGRYNFAHALIQHTLYEDLGPNRRARAHRRVAEALEELCGDRPGNRVGELARHWFSATQPIDVGKAINYSRQAGDAALNALAPADALLYYAQALDLYPQATDPDPVLAIDLAIGLGTAQRQSGDPASRDTLVDAARRAASIGDTERLVAAALANDRGYVTSTAAVDIDKVAILEEALARLTKDHPDRALVLATLCSDLTFGGPLERRRSLADEALAIAHACADDAIIVRVLNHIFVPLDVPSLHQESLTRSADALARAKRIGDPMLIFFAALWQTHASHRAGDIDEMDRCLEIQRSLAEQLNQPQLQWTYTYNAAMRAMIAGDTDQAEELVTEALQIGTDSGEPDAAVFYSAQLLPVNHQRGNLDELVPVLEEMIVEAPDVAHGYKAGLAFAHAQADRIEDAAHLLAELANDEFNLPIDAIWLSVLVWYAEAAIECHDPKYAAPLFDRLAPYADQLATIEITAEGPVSHSLGGLATVLGRYDEADAYFAKASATSARIGAKFFAACTNLSWGKMLSERGALGDTDKARNLLTEARVAAVDHGYANIERRATQAIKDLD